MAEQHCPHCGGTVVPSPVGRRWICRPCGLTVIPVRKAEHIKRHSTTRGRSDRQEKRTAKKFKGRRTRNSGAGRDKADVKVAGILRIEDKTTRFKSFSLKRADLRKLGSQCMGDEMPVFKIAFEDDLSEQYCVIPEHWLLYLLKEAGLQEE